MNRFPHTVAGRPWLIAFVATTLLTAVSVPKLQAEGGDAYKWSVQYLVDQSQSAFGRSQQIFPRHNRSIAISPDGRYLYASYHQSHEEAGEVRRIDLQIPDYVKATLRVVPRITCKAIAVDDEGRVYLAAGNAIHIYDANLSRPQYQIETETCEGVAVTREGSTLVLWQSERNMKVLRRWVLEKSGGTIVNAKLDGFDGTGELSIPNSESLRQITIDANQRIWVTDPVAGKVFRMDKDGNNATSTDVKGAMAVGVDGTRYFVTQSTERQITILDDAMAVVGTLKVPWEQLELAPRGNHNNGAISGIVMLPGRGFLVSNERGQTAGQRSTYGKVDDYSEVINDKLFVDTFADDNEPILRAELLSVAEQ